jgi:hypothetical protein
MSYTASKLGQHWAAVKFESSGLVEKGLFRERNSSAILNFCPPFLQPSTSLSFLVPVTIFTKIIRYSVPPAIPIGASFAV